MPNEIPISRADSTVSQSTGTVFTRLIASAIGTDSTSGGISATIPAESTFADQSRRGGTESSSQDAIKRRGCAPTLQMTQHDQTRLLPGQFGNRGGHTLPTPPNRCSRPGFFGSMCVRVPPLGKAPSATTTMLKRLPNSSRLITASATFAVS